MSNHQHTTACVTCAKPIHYTDEFAPPMYCHMPCNPVRNVVSPCCHVSSYISEFGQDPQQDMFKCPNCDKAFERAGRGVW